MCVKIEVLFLFKNVKTDKKKNIVVKLTYSSLLKKVTDTKSLKFTSIVDNCDY